MRIAICDDEKEVLEEVGSILSEIKEQTHDMMEICLFQDADDFEYEIEEMPPYDIAFLDIELGAKNGIQLAEKMKKNSPTVAIIFMTGHYQYVYDVFEVQPVGFVKKPIRKEEIRHEFEKAARLCDLVPVFSFSNGKNFYRIPLKNIYYLISEKRKVILYTTDGEEMYYGKLDDTEQKLREKSENFIRVGQSVIINMRYLKKINYHKATLEVKGNTLEFNISQKYRVQVRHTYSELWNLS